MSQNSDNIEHIWGKTILIQESDDIEYVPTK